LIGLLDDAAQQGLELRGQAFDLSSLKDVRIVLKLGDERVVAVRAQELDLETVETDELPVEREGDAARVMLRRLLLELETD
jgi:hypothetical protein